MTETTSTEQTSEVPPTFSIPEEYVQDGKILGQFESIPAMMDALGSGQTVPPVVPPADPAGNQETSGGTEGTGGPLQISEPPTAPEGGLTDEEMQAYSKQYFDNGKLDEDAYAALQAKGIPRVMVDQYIQGQQAMYQQAQAQVEKALGGAEQVQKVLQWAEANLTPERRDSLNKQLATADPATAATILRGLSVEAQIPTGGLAASTTPSLAASPFRNDQELYEAIGNPRYKTDSAYRNEVQERAKASQIAGTI